MRKDGEKMRTEAVIIMTLGVRFQNIMNLGVRSRNADEQVCGLDPSVAIQCIHVTIIMAVLI